MVTEEDGQKSIELNDWKFTTTKRPILNQPEMLSLTDRIVIPFPEMFFGFNQLEINTPRGSILRFNAIEALEMVNHKESDLIKVAMAEAWTNHSVTKHKHIKDIIKSYDWTYTTEYIVGCILLKNTLENSMLNDRQDNNANSIGSVVDGEFYQSQHKINTEKLSQPDPILFFDDVVLYEDELGDNGSGFLSVKIRIMPTAFLVLSRFFLRVDGVIVKILDTRVYHQFGTSILIREFKERVLGFEALVKLLPISLNGKPDMTLLTNMDYVSKLMDDSCVVRCLTDHMLV